nr:hypothetical protein [Tanacetum cinerariifolium]
KPHDESSSQVPKGSRNPNPTVSSSNSPADQMETLTVESPILTVSSPVLTACLNVSSEPSSTKDAANQEVKNNEPSLRYIVLPNWAHDPLLESTSTSPTPTLRIHKDHLKSLIIGPVDTPIQTRQPKRVSDALQDPSWVEAIPSGTKWVLKNMKDERGIVVRNKARLVAQGHTQEEGIDYDEVLKNKKDKRGIVVRNKARLVAQGHTQEERIDYDEVFAPVARIEAIRLFLAYASFMGFTVYQMDVKSAFLYGTIDEEVYVMQPPGFYDPVYPAKVYKVEKAMYRLHQAPRAWYGTLSKYLLKNGFQRGTIDQTLFIRRQRKDFILVQVYVDDTIFRSSNPQLCKEFKALMHEKFQMSALGELNFFLGLQVLQKEDGIFLSQDKYIGDILSDLQILLWIRKILGERTGLEKM